MLSLQFFTYKGIVGATSNFDEYNFNCVNHFNKVGIIVQCKDIGMPTEVKEVILKNIYRLTTDVSGFMLSRDTESISLLGIGDHLLNHPTDKNILISSNCDLNLLDNCIVIENNPPKEFIEWLDHVIT